MAFIDRIMDAEDIPLRSIVRTPLGLKARVVGYRGKRRGPRVWLVCQYLKPRNKQYAVVLLLPELVEVIHAQKSR